MTAPGTAQYIDGLSYFLLDTEKARELIESDFDLSVVEENTGDTDTSTTTEQEAN